MVLLREQTGVLFLEYDGFDRELESPDRVQKFQALIAGSRDQSDGSSHGAKPIHHHERPASAARPEMLIPQFDVAPCEVGDFRLELA
jgi:hypothetical protein